LSSNIQVAALSDVGCVRTNNEDNFGYDPSNDLYVVCDGMGGMAAGEVASAIACSTVISVFAAQPVETPIVDRMSLAIHAANDAVCQSGQLSEHKGMGTTLVAAAIQGSKLLVGNVGDSRCYIFQKGACMQLTLDHSYVNELVRAGSIKIEDIHSLDLEQFASVITRAIGAAHDVEPDFFFVDLHDGDAILLASDGLTRYVEGASIAELVDPANLQSSCQALIDKAKAAGGADNITCILLRYDAPVEALPEPTAEAAAETPATVETPTEAVAEPPAEPAHEAIEEPSTDVPTEDTAAAPEEVTLDFLAGTYMDTPSEPAAEAPVEAAPDAVVEPSADAPEEHAASDPEEVTLDFLAGTDTPVETTEAATETPAKPTTDSHEEPAPEAPAEKAAGDLEEVTLDFLAGTDTETPAETSAEKSEVPPPHVSNGAPGEK
jgi:serine/threonine protein phosphatase PrpC